MQALLDLIFAVEGSVADAAKKLGYVISSYKSYILFHNQPVHTIYVFLA